MTQQITQDEIKVLTFASITEFCERYSYYMIQALLLLFLIKHFHLSNSTGAVLVGNILGMIYISALVGGYIADKLLNYYIAAYIGSILLLVGSLILSLINSKLMLFIGLSFISISTGLIKANMASFISAFYDKSKLSNEERAFGFSVFYVGINIGGFIALFLASVLSSHYGELFPFYSSVILSCLLVLNLTIGRYKLKPYITSINYTWNRILKVLVILLGYIVLACLVMLNNTFANYIFLIATIGCGIVLIYSAQQHHWKNVAIASIVYLLSIIYWALYFQIFISVLLFIQLTVAHNFFMFHIHDSQFLSLEALAVIILGSIVGRFWVYRSNINKTISDIDKFNIGYMLLTLVFIIFYCSTSYGNINTKVSALWVILAFINMAISELSFSAIGLSVVTRIAPPKFVSLYMAIWLVTLGLGGKLSGILSKHINITNDIALSKISMAHGLIHFITLSICGVILCFIVRKKINNTILNSAS